MKIGVTVALLAAVAAPAAAGEHPKEHPTASKAEAKPEAKPAAVLDLSNQGRHVRVPAGEVKWSPAPPSVPAGAMISVLEGDPKQPGISTFRLKLPAGYKVPPHWHPADERVTVLSGTFALGNGEKWDDAALQELPAGSFSVMPPKHAHFAMAKEEAVIQLTIVGPWGINYFNPADDPRKSPPPVK